MMFVVHGLTHDEMTAELDEFERLFHAAVLQVMREVARHLGEVTVAATEPVPEPGEPATSMDTLALIATLWAAQVAAPEEGESEPDGTLIAALRRVFRKSVERIRQVLQRERRRVVPEIPVPPTSPIPVEDVEIVFPDRDLPEREDTDTDREDDDLDLPGDVAADYLSLASNRMVRFSDELWDLAREQLLEGFAEGESIEELRDRLIMAAGLSEARATVVARTECLPPTAPVEAANITALFRRWYEGEWIEIVTASGRKFSGTPNHPVLTVDGWRGLGELVEGDNLVCNSSDIENLGSTRNENVETPPPTISEIFDAVSAVVISERERTGKPDFHGDGADGYVDVLRPDLILRHGEFSALSERSVDSILSPTDYTLLLKLANSNSFSRDIFIHQSFSRFECADWDTRNLQSSIDPTDTTPVLSRERYSRFAALIRSDDLGFWEVSAQPSMNTGCHNESTRLRHSACDSSFTDNIGNSGSIATYDLGNSISAKARLIQLDKVVSCVRTEWSGHVYNLTTEEGYFLSNGVYTSNTISASNAGSLAMVQYSEFTGTKSWLSTEDLRTRPSHVEADGQTVPLEDFFEVGGFPLLFPGDPAGPPQETIQCRCTTTYQLDDEPLVASVTTEELNTVSDLLEVVTEEEPLVAADSMVMPVEASAPTRWEATLVVEDVPTGDGRMFSENALTWTDFPMPLLWQKVTSHGGSTDETVIVGNIESIEREGNQLIGRGTLDLEGVDGAEAFRMIRDKFLRGISVDVDSISQAKMEYVYPVDVPADAEFVVPELVIFHAGRLRGATLCAIPAFVEAFIRLLEPEPELEEEPEMIMATGGIVDGTGVLLVGESGPEVLIPRILPVPAEGEEEQFLPAFTAASYVLTIPDVPPAYWFEEPADVEMHGALTVTDEGRVYGFVAPARVAHRSFERRVEVPMGNVDYSRFMGRETIVDGGRLVTGALTMDCGHASTGNPDGSIALEHYDNACSVVATVRIGETAGKGVWVAGALMPGITANQISRMMACQLSGDWRPHKEKNGWREFAGALLVPVPGFAMARAQASVRMDEGALVSSAVPVRFEEVDHSCGCSLSTEIEEINSPLEDAPLAPSVDLSQVAEFIARSIGRDAGTRVRELRTLIHGAEV